MENVDQDSDEENQESSVITITDSSTSSLESPLPWANLQFFVFELLSLYKPCFIFSR